MIDCYFMFSFLAFRFSQIEKKKSNSSATSYRAVVGFQKVVRPLNTVGFLRVLTARGG